VYNVPPVPTQSSRILSKLRTFLSLLLRLIRISLTLSPLTILAPLSLLPSQNLHSLTWRYTHNALQSLGPCFVKLAQWASTRRDLFPPWLCDGLGKLHDGGRKHRWEHTERTIRGELGKDHGGVEVHEGSKILGSGCVAQVYR